MLALPITLSANIVDTLDNSKAGTDGPHVFYRGKNVVVKYIVERNAGTKGITRIYPNKKATQLTCMIPESGDQFSFLLQDSLSTSPSVYPASKRLLALSDIEGNFQSLKIMLQSAGVMDEQFNWTYGTGDLVLNGDFFDRGLNVTETLWLLYKLDGEAKAAGGKLHFILGNHEIMNLQGKTQYVRNKYLKNVKLLGEDYKYWFDENSELGRWLRTKNAVEKIGDLVFCHGGISLDLVNTALSLSEINKIVRQNLGKSNAEITSPEAKIIFDKRVGIFWYREMAKNLLPKQDIDAIMAYLGAESIVLGHTLKQDLVAYYEGRVICIDLYHDENLRKGFVKALLVADGVCFGIDSNGEISSIFSGCFPNSKK